MSSKRLAKRFYKSVTVAGEGKDWRVLIDDMQLRTPGKVKLVLPSKPLAECVAAEWDAQEDVINPNTMPSFTLINLN